MSTRSLLLNRSGSAAFLCYHSVAPEGPRYLTITPELFERQLAAMRRWGWGSGSLTALAELIEGRRQSSPLAFLTFDDGYADNFENALPIMREHGFGGLVFVLPPYVEDARPLDWPEVAGAVRDFPQTMRSMSWDMAERMAEHGIEFGSHTLRHPHLPALGDEELRQELLDSRRAIERRLGRCESIGYPFGEWSPRVARAAADAGYRFGFCLAASGPGAGGPTSIVRVAVDYRDEPARLRLKLSPLGRRAFASPLTRRVRALVRR